MGDRLRRGSDSGPRVAAATSTTYRSRFRSIVHVPAATSGPARSSRNARAAGADGAGDRWIKLTGCRASGSVSGRTGTSGPSMAERGTSATPKPSRTKRTTLSDVLSSNAIERRTPARSAAASTWRRRPDSGRISTNSSPARSPSSTGSADAARRWPGGNAATMDLYLPAFPLLADDLGTTDAAVQLTLTADVVGLLIGQLILGPLSDQWGRRRLLLGSTLVCAVASVLCALAPSVGWLVAWRFLQGMAGAGGIVLARAIATDVARGVAAAALFSLFMTVSSVAPILAPVIGGVLLSLTGTWQPMFYLLAIICLVLTAIAARALPEMLPVERRHAGGLGATGRAFGTLMKD